MKLKTMRKMSRNKMKNFNNQRGAMEKGPPAQERQQNKEC